MASRVANCSESGDADDSKRKIKDDLHDVEVELNELEFKVMKQKQNIRELEKKMENLTRELDVFQNELLNFKKQKESVEIKTSKFRQGFHSDQTAQDSKTFKSDTKGATNVSTANFSSINLSRTNSIHPSGTEISSFTEHTGSPEFSELRSCYDDIIASMPDNYMETVQLLERHLCSRHISEIFECTSATDVNQSILKCLIEKLTCRADILNVCDILLTLRNVPQLIHIVEDLKTTIIKNPRGTQDFQGSNPIQSITSTPAVNITSSRDALTEVTETHLSHWQSGNVRIAQRVANRSEDISLNDIRSCDETKASKPTMVYIQRLVIPSYAKHWKQIGTELQLDDQILDIIEVNYAPYPRKVELCCREMITQWLAVDTTATWMKLLNAIDEVSKYPDAIAGLLFQPPPTLPTHYIERPKLLQEITEKVLSTEIDNTVHITVVITGMAGFGKSTIAVALCHQQLIKKHFPNGFLRIQLGLTPKNKYYMLSQIYRALTGNTWTNPTSNPQGAVSEDDMVTCLSEELSTLCKKNPRLLVIIDDVWDVDDAADYVEIFSGCKIVLTTRRKDVASSIDCKHKICIDSMESSEAIKLLTFNIKDLQINNSDITGQLNELAMNLHNWPLLLTLVRGQLHIHCRTLPNSPLTVIKQVTKNLYDNGLTAFDPKKPKRQNAVNASIKASLDLLSEENVTRLNRLVTSVVFSSTIPKQLLMCVWQLSNEKMSECCNDFWSVGLFTFTSSLVDKTCIEIHLVITQYVFDNVKYDNAMHLVLNGLVDWSNQIQYYMQYFMSKPEMELLDTSQFGSWMINTLDFGLVPIILYKMPLMLQALSTLFHDAIKDHFLYVDVEELQKQSFMRVKDKYKTLVYYLNNENRDQAIALITEEYDKYTQHFTKLLNCLSSCIQLPLSFRNFYKSLVNILSPCFPQFAKVYVNMRSDLYDLYMVSKTFSLERLFDIIKNSVDQVNKLVMPMIRETSAFVQTILAQVPNNVDLPRGFQTADDLSMLCQSSDNSTFLDLMPSISTYISQNPNALSNTSCKIS